MNNQTNKPYHPILPFDITFGERHQIYETFAYVRDIVLCEYENKQYKGNVIKYYLYSLNEPRKIGGV